MSTRVRQSKDLTYTNLTQWTRNSSGCSDPAFHLMQDGVYKAPNGSWAWMEDTVTAKFRSRSAKGETFFNPMRKWNYAVACSGEGGGSQSTAVACSTTGAKATWEFRGPWIATAVPSELRLGTSLPRVSYALTDADIDRAKVEVCTDVLAKRGRTDSNLWETMAEYDQAVGMFKPTMNKLVAVLDKAARATQRGRTARLAITSASGLWLQYRYGIKPLIGDMEHILKTIRTFSKRVERRSTRSTKTLYGSGILQGSTDTPVGLRVTWANSINDRVTLRAMSLDEVDLSFYKELGFGEKSLATLPWELVPYSFVVDWFLNVGDYINAMVPAGNGWKSLGSCLSMERVTTNVYTPTSSTSTVAGFPATGPMTGSVGVTLHSKDRGPMVSPRIVVKSDFRLDNVTRVTDGLGLIAQKFVDVFGGGSHRSVSRSPTRREIGASQLLAAHLNR